MPETLKSIAEDAFSDGDPQKALHFACRHIDVQVILVLKQLLTVEEFDAELDWFLKFIERIRKEYHEEHLSQVLADEIDGTIESLKSLNGVLSGLEGDV